MERTTAKKIMGKNFLGPEELRRISRKLGIGDPFKMNKRLPDIPFTDQHLKRISQDYILVLGIPKDSKGRKLTINRMREIFGWNPQKAEPCFYNQDWYLKEKFAEDKTLDSKWYLIKKTVDKKTYGKAPEIIAKTLKQKEVFPPAILTAFVFFAYYLFNKGEILWKNDFIWCSDKDHNNDRIYTGRYIDPKKINKNGFNIHRHLAVRSCYGLAPQNLMKVDAIFQVRMGSTRLPGKMFKKIMGKALLWHVVQRVKAAHLVDRIILATTQEKKDDRVVKFAQKMKLAYYRGSTDNVLDRVYRAAKKFGSDVIVRITPDDPFKDPKIIDEFVSYFLKNKFDYVSNTVKAMYPEGLDIEVFSFSALEKAWLAAKKPSEKEHLTPYIWKNPKKFKVKNLALKNNLSFLRWTIDYQKDLEFARAVYKKLYPKKKIFLMTDILNLLKRYPELSKINQNIPYHEGYLKSLKEDKLVNKKETNMKNKKLWRIGKEELQYIKKAIEGGLKGEFNKRLEEEFAKKFGVNFAVSVNSGNSALHCALFACDVKPGDEVIVPPLTFASPAFAAIYLGAVPVFADVDPETFNIDPKDIERKITEKTKAIIPVSLYGLPTDIDAIMAIAKKNNLKVIEDNAECMLGKYEGRIAGTVGDMSIFSFERSKHLTTGNGGMIITNNEQLAEKARKFSILGYSTLSARQDSFKTNLDVVQHPDFKRHVIMGFNYRLPEVCAAMALAQLEKIDMLVEMRQKIAKLYSKAVGGCTWLIPQKTPEGFENAYWTYVMKLDTNRVSWDDFRKVFVELGGERYYGAWSINYLEPVFAGMEFPESNIKYVKGLCPVAEELQPRLIQLKTNFGDIKYAESQAAILKRTIERLTV